MISSSPLLVELFWLSLLITVLVEVYSARTSRAWVVKYVFTTYVTLESVTNAAMRIRCQLIVKSWTRWRRKHSVETSLRTSNGECCVVSLEIRLNHLLRVTFHTVQ